MWTRFLDALCQNWLSVQTSRIAGVEIGLHIHMTMKVLSRRNGCQKAHLERISWDLENCIVSIQVRIEMPFADRKSRQDKWNKRSRSLRRKTKQLAEMTDGQVALFLCDRGGRSEKYISTSPAWNARFENIAVRLKPSTILTELTAERSTGPQNLPQVGSESILPSQTAILLANRSW